MCQQPQESATIAISGVQRKMDKIVSKHQRELTDARQQIGLFLKANKFPNGGDLRCRWIQQKFRCGPAFEQLRALPAVVCLR